MTTFRLACPLAGSPAVVDSLAFRPLALRPRLSTGLLLAQRKLITAEMPLQLS
jgi:hypothetical protein